MSKYTFKLAEALIDSLQTIPSAQPAQVAGYWANRDFFLAELQHLKQVSAEYEERVDRMSDAFAAYVQQHGGPHFHDEFGDEIQTIRYTSTNSQRERKVGEARAAIKRLADRALNLGIIDGTAYDQFLITLSN